MAGRGAAPAGLVTQARHSGGARSHPPGPLGAPAGSRQYLFVRYRPFCSCYRASRYMSTLATKRNKQGSGARRRQDAVIGAPRGARRGPSRIADTIGLRFSARHPPSGAHTLWVILGDMGEHGDKARAILAARGTCARSVMPTTTKGAA